MATKEEHGRPSIREPGRANVTSLDVARLAGVSQSAVSRVFTPGSSASPAMREAVLAAARKLNYVPNTLARSLSTQRSDIVALMIGDTQNSAYSALLAEACRRLEQIGKHVLLFNSPDPERFDNVLLEMLQYQVDAIVIAAASMSSRMAGLCLDRGVPVVMLARAVPGLPVHTIRCDDAQGGEDAAQVLAGGARGRFGAILGDENTSTNRERLAGYLRGLQRSGVDPGTVVRACGGYTYDGGYRAALELMRLPGRPDSIFCLTDLMALGAMDALRSGLGLRIPEDVAIFGFDDIAEASRAAYSISTIREPFVEMMDHMVRLIAPSAGRAAEPELVEIRGEVVLRGSTRSDA
jgi:DNA-binding LacI/PurR family transcriptional regulator